MIDLSKRTTELVNKLGESFHGITLHGRPECEDEWNENYAIICDVYWDDCDLSSFNAYQTFDIDRFLSDFKQMIRDHYSVEDGEAVHFFEGSNSEASKVKGVVIVFYEQAQEIEVYRNV